MKLNMIGKMCVTLANRAFFRAKKHSPELCLIGAGISGIACVVEACKATHKSEPVFAEHKEAIEEAKEYLEVNPDNFDDDEKKRYVGHIYAKTTVKLVRNYAPAAALGLLSGGLVFAGYRIMAGRNLALLSALAAEKAKNMKLLEERQKKELPPGDEAEQEEKPVADKHNICESLTPDEARFKFFWGEGDKFWQDPKVYGGRANPFQLEQIESLFNKLLPVKQVIFVNEILDYFGKHPAKTYEGQCAGWIYDPKKGSHQIDFGLRSGHTQTIMFMDGEDTSGVWVCLNAENYIMDRALPRLGDMKDFYARGGASA